ncbi:phage head closure protein [Enterococcus pallens]|uniref:Phage head-tail adaptor n=1 Tax=Enterococcus pallens ATCC BAA-351 TaxID=1158607 RepID=R2QMH0_9ENTE|nr:phage head closure protein [Enterococcus pallens]EOH96383.1 hypothetical protein UAU_01034 [Enterococcus pallens ATCC BAA-351]EOU14404.1 hypothetical protein I588_04760 [Enterococcus pallens ATCC BAA-351]
MDRIRETFNDGVMYYGRNKDILSDKKKIIGKEFAKEGKLFFRELSIRDQDYRVADGIGKVVDMKIKTVYPPSFKKVAKHNLVGKIDGSIYEVFKVDHDSNYLYFYLTKVGECSGE